MTIEEKPRALEFTYTMDDVNNDLKYEVTYDNRQDMLPLKVIHSNGSSINYPIEFFVEVVNFLKSKGVIDPSSNIRIASARSDTLPQFVVPVQTTLSSGFSGNIPVPQIEKKGEDEAGYRELANVDPLTSFDIDPTFSPKIKAPGIIANQSMSNNQVAVKSKEVITRPVIRTKVKKGDPLSSERESAELRSAGTIRSAGTKGHGKVIKKLHKVENN